MANGCVIKDRLSKFGISMVTISTCEGSTIAGVQSFLQENTFKLQFGYFTAGCRKFRPVFSYSLSCTDLSTYC